MEDKKLKVAIIHYWLVGMRGGEKVLETLLEMYPQADIFTHVYDETAVSDIIKEKRIFTSRINKLPNAKKNYQSYMPFMPKALIDFNLQEYDLVISSESGPAKGVVPNPNAFHLCYCHTPMRYIWDMYHDYLKGAKKITRFFMKRLTPSLRDWDSVSSNMVDSFAANSSYVAKRIRRYYNRESNIVYPPVDINKFKSVIRNPRDYYLFFGQLTGYKRADIAIDACVKSGRKLVVAGAGLKKNDIKKFKNNSLITFKGVVSDEEIKELFAGAKALLFPGIEDFGIIPVEAQATGCPVVAYRDGGALETVKDEVTGMFFDEQTPDSLITALDYFEKNLKFHDRNVFNDHVQQFSKEAFKERIETIINQKKRL